MIARQLQGGPKYFLDADIKGCFDNISHEYLLEKLNISKMFKRQIEAWLKTDIMTSIVMRSTRLEPHKEE